MKIIEEDIKFTLADPGGTAGVHPPPQQDQFLSFSHTFCQKVYTSEVGTPPMGWCPPQWEILDPPPETLSMVIVSLLSIFV